MTYYDATAHPFARRPLLQGSVEADLCVVGGGCTGLAASLFAARRGYRVILLEAGRIGSGASGRNGGQLIPGLRRSPKELARSYGIETARRLFTLAVSARDLVAELVREHRIDCDLCLTGHLQTAQRRRDLDAMTEDADFTAARMGYPNLALLDRAQLAEELEGTPYCGAVLDRHGGHYHPLNYTLGLARAAEEAGAILHEDSPVLSLDREGGVQADTAEGSVRAKFAVLACDALIGRLDRRLAGRIMPIASHVVTTPPLAPEGRPIRCNRAVSDSLFAVNYFRLTADHRLLFGGGERYLPGETRDIAALVRKPFERIFPQLNGIPFEHRWSGLVSITTTRLPDIGRRGPVFYAHGYSGQGAALSTLAGKVLAEAMAGLDNDFDLLAGMAPPAFPGGTHLRTPLHLLAMLWFALRDRVG